MGWGRGTGCRNPKPQEGCSISGGGGLSPASAGVPATWGGAPPMLTTVQLFKVESLLENQDSPASSSWPESPLAPKPLWGQGPLRGGGV